VGFLNYSVCVEGPGQVVGDLGTETPKAFDHLHLVVGSSLAFELLRSAIQTNSHLDLRERPHFPRWCLSDEALNGGSGLFPLKDRNTK